MSRIFLICFILVTVYITPSQEMYATNTQIRQRGKLASLEFELGLDAKKRLESIQHIRRMYHHTTSFLNAELIFELRKKYKRMLQCYRSSFISDRGKVFTLMVEVHKLALDIGKLVDMILEDRNLHQSRSERHENHKVILRTRMQKKKAEDEKKKAALRQNMMRIGRGDPEHIRRTNKNTIFENGFDSDKN